MSFVQTIVHCKYLRFNRVATHRRNRGGQCINYSTFLCEQYKVRYQLPTTGYGLSANDPLAGFYPDRAACGYCHHWNPGGVVAGGGCGSEGQGDSGEVPEQREAVGLHVRALRAGAAGSVAAVSGRGVKSGELDDDADVDERLSARAGNHVEGGVRSGDENLRQGDGRFVGLDEYGQRPDGGERGIQFHLWRVDLECEAGGPEFKHRAAAGGVKQPGAGNDEFVGTGIGRRRGDVRLQAGQRGVAVELRLHVVADLRDHARDIVAGRCGDSVSKRASGQQGEIPDGRQRGDAGRERALAEIHADAAAELYLREQRQRRDSDVLVVGFTAQVAGF
jgi:hypothetical protein